MGSLLVRSGTDNTEAQTTVLVVAAVAGPAGNPAEVVVVVTAATTVIAVVAVVRADIPAPLPDVATHVI